MTYKKLTFMHRLYKNGLLPYRIEVPMLLSKSLLIFGYFMTEDSYTHHIHAMKGEGGLTKAWAPYKKISIYFCV